MFYADDFRKHMLRSTMFTFRMAMDGIDTVHTQMERFVDLMMGGTVGFQNHVSKIMKDWLQMAKSMREKYREMAEKMFDSSLSTE